MIFTRSCDLIKSEIIIFGIYFTSSLPGVVLRILRCDFSSSIKLEISPPPHSPFCGI